jgi:hypothetical protein
MRAMKSSGVAVSASRRWNSALPMPSVIAAREDDGAAAAHDVERRDHALDRLVVRVVEREARRRGDDHVGRPVELCAHVRVDRADARGVRRLEIAGEDAGQAARTVDGDVAQEVDADAARDADSSAWNGLSSISPGPISASSIAAPCRLRIVSTPAQPGATALRPPE